LKNLQLKGVWDCPTVPIRFRVAGFIAFAACKPVPALRCRHQRSFFAISSSLQKQKSHGKSAPSWCTLPSWLGIQAEISWVKLVSWFQPAVFRSYIVPVDPSIKINTGGIPVPVPA
jgi:hypothetical protein